MFAHCGVGSLRPGRWNDVPVSNKQLAGWRAAGMVSDRGPKGEEAPEDLPQACCGGGR